MNCLRIFIPLLSFVALSACTNAKKIPDSLSTDSSGFLTLDEAVHTLRTPEAAAKFVSYPGISPELPVPFRPPFSSVGPYKLFDNFYFVGTTAVGAFVIDSGDGLIMIDTGCSDADAEMKASDMNKLGLNPSKIKLILLSHEHFDHYGGVAYFKKNICPGASVALSLTGWNMLQSVPPEWAYIGSRPESIDIYLTDGMKIKLGTTTIRIIATPGHSPGCVSFIFPVLDNGIVHMAGLMGGSAVWPTHTETSLYKSSIEYFKAFAREAKCDVGFGFHSQESDFKALPDRKPGETNPLVIGTEAFDTVYLQRFRNRYQLMITSGNIKPY
jgi:metallo-beta-lactamase class B